jgi:hypothetical protein
MPTDTDTDTDTNTATETVTETVTVTVTVTVPPADTAAFQSFYLAELDSRVQRSEVVGAITLKKGSAALFFEPSEGKFTLVEKMPDVEEANVFDCVPREQWGRMVMLFGHATNTGGYIASGHAVVDANTVKIKLASGHYYRIDVDAALPHLQPFAGEPGKPRQAQSRQDQPRQQPARREQRQPARSNKIPGHPFSRQPYQNGEAEQQVSKHSTTNDESEDLTEEDLRRLRGEMPLTSNAKKKWKH